MKTFISSFSSFVLPGTVLAHTGHEQEGFIAQIFSAEHIIANSIAFTLITALVLFTAYKQYKLKINSLNK